MDALNFFNTVTRPNITAAVMADDDYRLVVNAILSIDASYGVMFEHLKSINHPFLDSIKPKKKQQLDDSDFKNQVADFHSLDFKVVRDAAFAIKHGRLNGKQARLVSSAEDISLLELTCGLFACGDALGASSVFIRIDQKKLERAWYILRKVELFTDRFLSELGIGPAECPLPVYHEAMIASKR